MSRAALPIEVRALFPDGTSALLLAAALGAGDASVLLAATVAGFHAELSIDPAGGYPSRRQCRLVVRRQAKDGVTAGLRVQVRLEPTPDPGWLVPGLFYGENRPADCTRLYPRFVPTSPRHDHLESDWWGFRADRAATPAVFAWDRTGVVALVTSERSDAGLSGIGFAVDGDRPLLRLDFPYREEPIGYDGSEVPAPPDPTFVRFVEGTTVAASFEVYALGPDRHGYADVLRANAGPADPPGGVAWVDVEEAADLAAEGLLRWHFRPDPPVLLETAAFDREALGERGDRAAMHVSWLSGTPYAYALMKHGRRTGAEKCVGAGRAVLDHVAANLAPGGTFFGQWTAARGWGGGWSPDPDRLHARTLADATLFLLRATADESARSVAHDGWRQAVRSNLDVASATQRSDGALGAAFSAAGGEVLDWRGSAGLAFVAPLAEAATTLGCAAYLEAARRAGRYYARFVESELLHGAPEDVDLAPTSEDGYLAVISYVSLWRADPDRRWLDLARRAAEWMLTFRYSYDVTFSPRTLLGHYRFRTTGADQASPANQHLHAFGLICLPEMVELARALDDEYLIDRTRENLACFRQFIAREDGDFGAYRGMASERYYQTACFQAKGMLLTLSHAWSVGVLLYACEAAIELEELRRDR